jgi:membrane protease YdiL (CAAX protease family)
MDERPHSNTQVGRPDVFSTLNNYFLLFFCASCIVSSMYVQQLFLMMEQYRLGIGVSALLGIIAPVYLITRRFGGGFQEQLRIAPPRLPQVVYLIVATLCAVVIVDQIYLITQQFSPAPDQYTESLADLRPTTGGSFAILFVGLCLLVPVAEEMVFRGYVQQIFARNMGPTVGFILAGLAFGVVHLNAHLLVSITFFGIFLSFIYFATGNLTYTIVAHSLFNTVALLQLTFMPQTEAEPLPFYLRDVRVLVFALVLLIYLLLKLKQGGPETEPPWESLDDETE